MSYGHIYLSGMHSYYNDNFMMIVEFGGLKNFIGRQSGHTHFVAVSDFGDNSAGGWYVARDHYTLIRNWKFKYEYIL